MERRMSNLTRLAGGGGQPTVRGAFESLTQGVSQQPPHLRQDGQGTEQINGWSSPVEGLRKRQPSRWRGTLFQDIGDYFVTRFVVVGDERYLVVVVPFDGKFFLRVLRLADLSICTVAVHGTGLSTTHTSYPDGDSTGWVVGDTTSYLANTEFLRGFAFINNGPLGLVLNRNKITAMAATLSPARVNAALIFIQGVAFDVTYDVYIDDVLRASYTTPKATDTNNTLNQSIVAEALRDDLSTAGFTVELKDYIVYVKKADSSAFDIRLDDGRGTTLGRAIGEATTSTSELPILAKDGFVVRTKNEPGAEVDDRWFKFRTFDGGTGIAEGTWEETVKPEIPYQLDEDTMPLVLYRVAEGIFFLGPADGAAETQNVSSIDYDYTFPDWGDRTAGDEETVPDPPFIGQAIRDHTIFRSRYMICAGNKIGFSEVDDIFNFFVDSTTLVQDTDAFDLQANSELSTDLSWLLVVDESVLVFSSDGQFTVRAAGDSDVLSARSSVILRVSSIELNVNLRPKLSGGNVMFATDEFGFTHVRELQAFDSQQRRLGLNLGGSLNSNLFTPKYVRGMGVHWDVGENLDYLAMLTDDDPQTLYVYKYLWAVSGNSVGKLQASWSKWTFSTDIKNFFFDRNSLVLFTNTATDGAQVIEIDAEELQLEEDPNILLDRRVAYPDDGNVSVSYDAITDTTTFTLPYSVAATARAVVRTGNEGLTQGILLGTATSGDQIVCDEKGDFTGKKIAFGEDYLFRYEFTPAYMPVRDQGRQRMVGELVGRLQLATWSIHHFNTGYYTVTVSRPQRSDSVSTFRARTLGVQGNQIGTETDLLDTGVFRVPIHCRNTDTRVVVESDRWLPVTLTGASWEGVYSDRSRRTG